MSGIERWSIDELLARYSFHPELDDVFVEGLFDVEVYSSCMRSLGNSSRVFYEIQSVDIPAGMLIKHSVAEGNKSRVMVLARELSAVIPKECRVRCIADRDLDHWFQKLEQCDFLIWSTYCAIELFFFDRNSISELHEIARCKIPNIDAHIKEVSEVLFDLYALRLADNSMDLRFEWPEFDRFLLKNKASIEFDLRGYMKRLLQYNEKMKLLTKFEGEVEVWRSKLIIDARLQIRGHDFIEVMKWVLMKFSNMKEIASTAFVERIFIMLAKNHPEIIRELAC